MNKQEQVQKIVIDYFKDVNNGTFVQVVDSFVYNVPSKSSHVSKLIESFISDNGLKKAFINYAHDFIQKNTSSFLRSNGSDIEMIELLKLAFLNAAFNRMRNIDHRELIDAEKVRVLFSELDVNVHIVGTSNKNYTICGVLIDGDEVMQWSATDKKTDCKHCLEIVNMCKSISP